MAAPKLTDKQRKDALEKAKEVRKARSELLASMGTGELSFVEGLEKASADEHLKRTLVKHMIRTQHGYGTVKTENLMKELGIADNRRVGGLGTRQRAALIEIFG